MPDPMVHVVHVGDGACTVLHRWPERQPGPTAVIDCGVWKAPASGATDRLLTALGGDLRNVEQFVVSHFDWDHWGGLRNLQNFPSARRTMSSATLYYPYMPRPVSVALYAMMGPLRGTGSAVLDLQVAMRPLFRPGGSLTLRPLHSGSIPIQLAGDDFDVLWPPERLGPNIRRGLSSAVRAVKALADAMAEDGYPELRENLDIASRAANNGAHSREVVESREDGLPQEDSPVDWDMYEDDDAFDDAEEDTTALGEPKYKNQHSEGEGDDLQMLDILPERWLGEYRRVLKKARAANNDLSLVIASQTGTLVAFGDIGGGALSEVLKGLSRQRFGVMLAPHHGSHKLPKDAPTASWCVAQCGQHHLNGWMTKHSPQHTGAGECWNTHLQGDLYPA